MALYARFFRRAARLLALSHARDELARRQQLWLARTWLQHWAERAVRHARTLPSCVSCASLAPRLSHPAIVTRARLKRSGGCNKTEKDRRLIRPERSLMHSQRHSWWETNPVRPTTTAELLYLIGVITPIK